MRSKKITLCVLLISMILLTGCKNVVPITDTELNQIATYTADVLLKYNKEYKKSIMVDAATEELIVPYKTTQSALPNTNAGDQPALSDENTTNKEPESNDIPSNGGQTNGGIQANWNVNSQESTNSKSTGSEATEQVTYSNDISSIINLEGISLTYKNYSYEDTYPNSKNSPIFVSSNEGDKLLVVTFELTNTLSESKLVDLSSEEINYKLIYNNEKNAVPMLTLLEDDLSIFKETLKAGQSRAVVLICQMADSLIDQTTSLTLTADSGNGSQQVQIYPK